MVLQPTARQGVRTFQRSIRSIQPHSRIPAAVSRSRLSAFSRSGSRVSSVRSFQISTRQYVGLMPDTSDPKPREAEEHDAAAAPAELDIDEYHQVADQYLEKLVSLLEAKQEKDGKIDVEYSAGVLSIDTEKGTIIINKQPPNKQIWWASPNSGPKRFDWAIVGEGMHEKEGGGSGKWTYLRDGTTLDEALKRELGVDMDILDLEGNADVVEKGGL